MNNNTQAFLALVRAGLWEQDVLLSQYGTIDYNVVYRIAEEQSVVGLVAAGIEHIKDVKVPQGLTLQFVGQTLQLEQRNMAMNQFIADLVAKMRKADIYPLLIKGQGVAQCYERPLWRSCGDVDFFLNDFDYKKAKSFLGHFATEIEDEIIECKHIAYTINSWEVEIHGSMRWGCLPKVDVVLSEMQQELFLKKQFRTWRNNDIDIFLPSVNDDILFIFSHILKHFYKEGIGLRQICDWCRLVWIYKDKIDIDILEKRLQSMGIEEEWKTFAVLAVKLLGMPSDSMPLFSYSKKGLSKSNRILGIILESGNFGHNRDNSYYNSYPVIIRKGISLWRHSIDCYKRLIVFPLNSVRVWCWVVMRGIKVGLVKL